MKFKSMKNVIDVPTGFGMTQKTKRGKTKIVKYCQNGEIFRDKKVE